MFFQISATSLRQTNRSDASLPDWKAPDGTPQCRATCPLHVKARPGAAGADQSFTRGDGLKRVVSSKAGISSLISSLNIRSALRPNHKAGHQHVSQHARPACRSASQARSDPKGTGEAGDTQQLGSLAKWVKTQARSNVPTWHRQADSHSWYRGYRGSSHPNSVRSNTRVGALEGAAWWIWRGHQVKWKKNYIYFLDFWWTFAFLLWHTRLLPNNESNETI